MADQSRTTLQHRMEGFARRSGVDLAAIHARIARAARCPKHRYEIGPGPYYLGAKYLCAHCGDEKRLMDIDSYVRGYQAAGGDPRDVCPDWKATP